MRRAVITVGLGFGDEGKGACVDALCRVLRADLVVRYSGGSQCGHNVELPSGARHTFSQFGAGTLAGVPAYLGQHVIIHLEALGREANHLIELGVTDPFSRLSVHPDCLVSTAFHREINRAREVARGARRHGSCGHGIGETRSYAIAHPDDAVRARDLADGGTLLAKLRAIRRWASGEFRGIVSAVEGHRRESLDGFDPSDIVPEEVAGAMAEVGSGLRMSRLLPAADTMIFEGAQGVLLDEWAGFHPHTTWSTVTTQHALELLEGDTPEEVCTLGLTRAFATRHGAGPLPTRDAALTTRLVDPGNPHNVWQGDMRAGWLDLPLLDYAAGASGSPLDGLAVSWLDRIGDDFKICAGYEGDIRLTPPRGRDLDRQEALGRSLAAARPVLESSSEGDLTGRLEHLAPVVMRSYGPMHVDREWGTLPWRRWDPRGSHGAWAT